MGAPVDAALGPTNQGLGGGTISGGGPVMHMAPAAYAAHGHYEPTPAPKKSSSALVVGLALVALLLGAGAVVAYVLSTQPSEPVAILPTVTPPAPQTPANTSPPAAVTPVTPATPLAPVVIPPSPGPGPAPAAKKDAGAAHLPQLDAGLPTVTVDAGSGQATIVTPFGTFEFPGPRPPFYPADQPWPPPSILPMPQQPH
jgi:hypothetical protein